MRKLYAEIPDPDVVLALEPEELGAKLLFLTRVQFAEQMFHPGNLISEIYSDIPSPTYARSFLPALDLALTEAWAWLEAQGLIVPSSGINGQNGFRRLSRRAKRFQNEDEFYRFTIARVVPKELFHVAIREKVWMALIRGEFDVAVFQAMKQVEIELRAAIDAPDSLVGVKLARQAFDTSSGKLTDKNAEGGEKQACSDLFSGALGMFKNAHSHRHVNINDASEALEQIILASHLLRVIDARKSQAGTAA